MKQTLSAVLVATALLGAAPAFGQSLAFVANYLDGTVSVIDLPTAAVVQTIDAPSRAIDVTMAPDGRRAFMVDGSGQLYVIDTETLGLVGEPIPLAGTESIEGVFSPDGSRLYVVNAITENISVVDAQALALVTTISLPAGGGPAGLAISPAGDRLYVSNFASDDVSVVDLAGPQLIATIPAGAGANGVAISPDGSRVYVANQSSDTLTVIDAQTHQALATVAAGTGPRRIVVSPDGARLYVPNLGQSIGTVTVLEAQSLEIVDTIEVGLGPTDLSVTPDGATAYVVNSSANTVSVVDLERGEEVETIGVGALPLGISNFIPCGGAGALCLQNGRFRVEASFRIEDAAFSPARFAQLTDATGYFWYFNPTNVELVIKVLDGCSSFDRFWVFAAGLTNVEVEITVTDTVAGTSKRYMNPAGTPFQPIQDTNAFATCP